MTSSDPVDPALARLLDDPAVWAEVSPDLRERTLAEALGGAPGAAGPAQDDEAPADEAHGGEAPGGEAHGAAAHGRTAHSGATHGGPAPADEAHGGGGGPSRAGPGGDELARRRADRARRPSWQRPMVLAAAAAVVVVVAVSAVLLAWGDGEPEGVEVALAGTEAQPDASATMHLRDERAGVSVTLEVDGLPPAPEGTFYEAWLVGPSGKVSAGTFHQRGDQDEIKLWLGVATDGYEALTVTRQPVDGGTVADGEVVLRGDLPPG